MSAGCHAFPSGRYAAQTVTDPKGTHVKMRLFLAAAVFAVAAPGASAHPPDYPDQECPPAEYSAAWPKHDCKPPEEKPPPEQPPETPPVPPEQPPAPPTPPAPPVTPPSTPLPPEQPVPPEQPPAPERPERPERPQKPTPPIDTPVPQPQPPTTPTATASALPRTGSGDLALVAALGVFGLAGGLALRRLSSL